MDGPRLMEVPQGEAAEKSDRKLLISLLALAAVVIAAVILYFALLGAQVNPMYGRASVWEENSYTNIALGLRIGMPKV